MIVDRNSWHYKYINAAYDYTYRRDNLCSYMRGFVKATIFYCFCLTAAVGILYMVACGILGWFFHYPSGSVEQFLWLLFHLLVMLVVTYFGATRYDGIHKDQTLQCY